MKIALCCIGRLENRYIREYVGFYLGIGVDKVFLYDNNYDGEEYFEDVIGVTIPREGRPETIKLQFSEHRYPYIIAKPIHGSMKIIDKNNRIVSVDVIPNKELESLILSFGNDVKILEPKHLRNKIVKILKSISDKYN